MNALIERLTASALVLTVAAAALGVGSSAHGAVSLAAGPVYNPATGHRYYRLAGGNWNSLRAFAVSMGGDLATINDAAENAWVRANVVGSGSKPFIGLNDAGAEGTLVWADGTASAFRNWRVGEPNNTATNDYVNFDGTPEGTWIISQADYSGDAIMEIAGGPIRVPGELPTLGAAVNAQPTSGTSEIVLAAGTHTIDAQVNITNVSVRGAGRGQTVLLGTIAVPPGALNYYTIQMSGQMNGESLLEDMTIVNRSTSPSVAAETGMNRVHRVEFTSQPDSTDAELVQTNFNNAVTPPHARSRKLRIARQYLCYRQQRGDHTDQRDGLSRPGRDRLDNAIGDDAHDGQLRDRTLRRGRRAL